MTFRRSLRGRRAALLFGGLFLLAVLTQLAVAWYERLATTYADLRSTADQIRQDLRYSTGWDLVRFRQSEGGGGSYYILDRSGLVIDIAGFASDLGFDVNLVHQPPGFQTLVVRETKEEWRLLVVPVNGGTVIIGVSPPEDITRLDERLQENARRFGDTLEHAATVSPSDIDRNLDFAVIDANGRLRFAIGGIPLRLRSYPQSPFGEIMQLRTTSGTTHALLSTPFVDESGQTVGTVNVVSDLPPTPWFSLRAWLKNVSSSLLLASVGTLIGIRYIPTEFRPEELLRDALDRGESSTVEFKEALRWDQWQGAVAKASVAEAVAIKTVAGFLNSRRGGALFIGVADDKQIVGLDRDYQSLGRPSTREQNDGDRFQLHLRNLLAAQIGRDISNLCVETAVVMQEGKDVCVVRVSPSPTAIYVGEGKTKAFYLRVRPATQELNVEETVAFCRERWPRRPWRQTPLWSIRSRQR